jgi:tetratricopeptide (TPR) repeat protein
VCSLSEKVGLAVRWFFLATLLYFFCFFHSSLPASEEHFVLATLSYSAAAPAAFEQSNASSAIWLGKSLEAALAEGRNSEAQSQLHSLLKKSQINPDILLKAGIHFAQKGLYDDAALAFGRCAQEHPEIFEAHYDLALAEFGLRHYGRAFSVLESAQARSREEKLRLFYLRGKIENALGQSREAKRDLTAAFVADPSNENYALDLGLYDLEHNAYPEAVKVFAQAQTFHPHSVFAGLGLALAQYLSGRIPGCILTCHKLLSEHPAFAPARTLLAFALYMQGSFQEAEAVAREGLTYPGPHPYLNYIDVAILLKLQSQDYKRMLAEIDTAERQIPACSLCYLAQSKIDEARRAKGSAVEDLEEAVRLDPAFSDAWYRLAALYDQTGQQEKAAQARARFTALKAAKSEQESEMLRSAFMRALAQGEP